MGVEEGEGDLPGRPAKQFPMQSPHDAASTENKRDAR